MMRSTPALAFLVSLFLWGSVLTAEEPSLQENRITVEAFDSNGRFLRGGLGFAYDEDTIVCSYRSVRGASLIEARIDGEKSSSNRLISYNDLFDLAILKTEHEIPLDSETGSSSTLATGDSVYFYSRQGEIWRRTGATVKTFLDSGRGYEMIRLTIPDAQADLESSPLYNDAGKIVGWMSRDSKAVSIRTIAQILHGKTVSVPLGEIGSPEKKCGSGKWHGSIQAGEALSFNGWVPVRGTPAFPFEIELPKGWNFERKSEAGRFSLEGFDEHFGICLGLRISPQQTNDLMLAIEKAETFFFAGFSRSLLAPYSADHFSGFLAHYDDPDPESDYAMEVFFAMSGANLYILSIKHPEVIQDRITPFMEQLVSSLRL